MISDILLLALGASAGAVITAFVMAEVATRQLAARDEEHQRETRKLHSDVSYWKAQAARYRASLDGSSGYWPRPLNPK